MSQLYTRSKGSLKQKYPSSPPCSCEVCLAYCARPGWWTVEEANRAIEAGMARRMMLEMAPDCSFGVLSPAFLGCEVAFAQDRYAECGCTFLKEQRCELYGSGLQPLECRYCHHSRLGQGLACHQAIERDWHTTAGQHLVVRWSKLTGFWDRLALTSAKPKARR